ncbi:hypothetical protein Aduo_012142 [Ancylostoma duodenale]
MRNLQPSFQRRNSIVSKVTKQQWGGMQTPAPDQQQHVEPQSTRIFSLTDVSARILSALPPIYLRDDHHDKYDTVAVRLLSESIQSSETEPRSTHNELVCLEGDASKHGSNDKQKQQKCFKNGLCAGLDKDGCDKRT